MDFHDDATHFTKVIVRGCVLMDRITVGARNPVVLPSKRPYSDRLPPSASKKFVRLYKSIGRRIDSFDTYAYRYGRNVVFISSIVVSVAFINTVFTALGQSSIGSAKAFGIAAIFTSALVTLVNAFDAILGPRERLTHNRAALNKMYDIRERLRWRMLDEKLIEEKELHDMWEEFRAIEKTFYENIFKEKEPK